MVNSNLSLNRNLFSNIPQEYSIPKQSRVVFVSDFFAKDLGGGAELTTEAIIAKAPSLLRSFRLHSLSLTPELLSRNPDKHWVLCNFTQVPSETIDMLRAGGFSYSVIEYDFKVCIYRSVMRHVMETGLNCDCATSEHGKTIESLYQGASTVFWMSDRQMNNTLEKLPGLVSPDKHLVISSVFDDKTLDTLAELRVRSPKNNKHVMLGGGSWIKGLEQTERWCKENGKIYDKINDPNYQSFLVKLAQYDTFVFKPLDYDTCPRIVIEAKLLGLNLELNGNVLHKDEPWFTKDIESAENYLRNNANMFWSRLMSKIA